MDKLSFFELYMKLRKKGFRLGIEDYKLLIQALHEGLGWEDNDTFKRLCKLLWVKSLDEGVIFEECYEEFITSTIGKPPGVSPASPPPESPTKPTHPDKIDKPPLLPQYDPPLDSPDTDNSSFTEDAPVIQALQLGGYIRIDDYFPIRGRMMRQSLRTLRHQKRKETPDAIDIAATIKRASERGMLTEFIPFTNRINQAELLLLVDHDGSMVPFHLLSHHLIHVINQKGLLAKTHIYYFHNCPDEKLFKSMTHLEFENLDDVLRKHFPLHTGVIIFSDAGAARNNNNPERIKKTKVFLGQLRQCFRHITWLNPMPRERWTGTSAEQIRQLVYMSELSSEGFSNIINVLRGRTSVFAQAWDNGHE